MSADSADLFDRLRAGDSRAFAELLAHHRSALRQAIALRLDRRLMARLDVSDVVQEACLEAARRLPDYLRAPTMPFGLWLRWLAREQLIMLHRKHLLADRRAVGRESPPLPADSSSAFVSAVAGRGPSPSQLATMSVSGMVRLLRAARDGEALIR